MNTKSRINSTIESVIKEHLVITCPEDITESVMKEIREENFESQRKINPLFVYTTILLSILLMIGLIVLISFVEFPEISNSGIERISFTFLEIPKLFIGIWKLTYFPIFIISFSLIVFIDIVFINRKKSIYS